MSESGRAAVPKGKLSGAKSSREPSLSGGLGLSVGPDDEWRHKADFHDLERAHEIMRDKGRHRAARHYGKQRLKAIARIVSGK